MTIHFDCLSCRSIVRVCHHTKGHVLQPNTNTHQHVNRVVLLDDNDRIDVKTIMRHKPVAVEKKPARLKGLLLGAFEVDANNDDADDDANDDGEVVGVIGFRVVCFRFISRETSALLSVYTIDAGS